MMSHETNQQQEDTIEADVRARLLLFAYLVILASGLFLFIDSLNSIKPLLLGESEQLLMAKQYLVGLFDYVLIFSVIHAVVLSILFISIANRARQSGCFPPPGTWVITRTTIKRGDKAKPSTWFCYACALIVWLPVALPIYLTWLLDEVVRL